MPGVNIRTLPAATGFAWLRAGLRLFARQPIALVMLVALGPLLSLSLALVPVVGQGLGLLLFPMILLGLLTVCRTADQGVMPGISSYLVGLRDPRVRLRLLQIGIVYALVVGLVSLAWTLVPDRADTRPSVVAGADATHPAPAPAPEATPVAPPSDNPADRAHGATPSAPPASSAPANERPGADGEGPNVMLTPTRVFVVLATLLISIPLQFTVLFATSLVAWHDQPSIKALFFGFFATWRNRTPILFNLLSLFGLSFVVLMAVAALIGLLGLSEETAQILLGPVVLLLLPIGTASSYAIVRAVIEEDSPHDGGANAISTEASAPGS